MERNKITLLRKLLSTRKYPFREGEEKAGKNQTFDGVDGGDVRGLNSNPSSVTGCGILGKSFS